MKDPFRRLALRQLTSGHQNVTEPISSPVAGEERMALLPKLPDPERLDAMRKRDRFGSSGQIDWWLRAGCPWPQKEMK